jgi:hypothetical protein
MTAGEFADMGSPATARSGGGTHSLPWHAAPTTLMPCQND